MKISSECAACVYLQLMRTLDHQKVNNHVAIQAQVMSRLASQWETLDNPGIAVYLMYEIAQKNNKVKDPYREDKRLANSMAETYWQQRPIPIDDLERRFLYAAAANIIDAGLGDNTQRLFLQLDRAIQQGFARNDIQKFVQAIPASGKILYISDNAGEIVFDRELIRSLRHKGWHVSILVRHHTFLNDVTRDDVEEMGLSSVADTVLDFGEDFTMWKLSDEDLQAWQEKYDGVIIKGIANLEALSHRNLQVPALFLYRAKCPPSARLAGVEGNTNVAWLKE
ncbi:damage-control phosphatase ARMT1 family protein [Sulfobacillus thermosulfidooxidans]|uniref:damage-control phosphatase ARMT1 family protein n=1 Tax=Sulfobacillus thermosulfidooxidans TaxID=28034 RepID=UPI0006B68521|nr:ARMT1-like domain-containing protein [Sulfobacillus thermosulfidooxidans]